MAQDENATIKICSSAQNISCAHRNLYTMNKARRAIKKVQPKYLLVSWSIYTTIGYQRDWAGEITERLRYTRISHEGIYSSTLLVVLIYLHIIIFTNSEMKKDNHHLRVQAKILGSEGCFGRKQVLTNRKRAYKTLMPTLLDKQGVGGEASALWWWQH